MIRQAPRELALVFRRPQIDADNLLGAIDEMNVRVVEPGEHEPARQVDDANVFGPASLLISSVRPTAAIRSPQIATASAASGTARSTVWILPFTQRQVWHALRARGGWDENAAKERLQEKGG